EPEANPIAAANSPAVSPPSNAARAGLPALTKRLLPLNSRIGFPGVISRIRTIPRGIFISTSLQNSPPLHPQPQTPHPRFIGDVSYPAVPVMTVVERRDCGITVVNRSRRNSYLQNIASRHWRSIDLVFRNSVER